MKFLLAFLFLTTSSPGVEPSITQEEKEQTQLALNAWIQKTEDASKMDPNRAIELLGTGVRKLSRPSIYPIDERLEVYEMVQKKLISIPGHAEYFGDMIRKATDDQIAGTHKYHPTERWWQYETLQQLPSPETVKVLGELLFDEKGQMFTDDPVRDSSLPQANCRYAAQSLAVLIDKPPYDSKLYPSSDSALDAWRLWYQQVKAGTRTFRFKDSPVSYTLTGPATDKPQPNHTTSRDQTGRGERATSSAGGDVTAVAPEKSPWPKIAAVVAAILALLGGWLAFRKRATSA